MGPIFDMLFPWPRALFSPGRSLRVGSGPLNYFIIRCSRELGSVPDVGGQVLISRRLQRNFDWRKLFFATLPSTFDNGLLKIPQERCYRKLFLAWHVNLRMKRTPRPYHDREICYCCYWMILQQICRFSVLVEADAITTIALPANFDLWQRDWRTAFERYAKELNVFVGTVGQNK